MLANGFDVAGFLRRRIWVSAHLKPLKKAAERIRMNPGRENDVSPDTMRMTPIVMTEMIRTKRMEGVSRRNRNAKRRTKARAEDLTMAAIVSCHSCAG